MLLKWAPSPLLGLAPPPPSPIPWWFRLFKDGYRLAVMLLPAELVMLVVESFPLLFPGIITVVPRGGSFAGNNVSIVVEVVEVDIELLFAVDAVEDPSLLLMLQQLLQWLPKLAVVFRLQNFPSPFRTWRLDFFFFVCSLWGRCFLADPLTLLARSWRVSCDEGMGIGAGAWYAREKQLCLFWKKRL